MFLAPDTEKRYRRRLLQRKAAQCFIIAAKIFFKTKRKRNLTLGLVAHKILQLKYVILEKSLSVEILAHTSASRLAYH